MILGFKKVFPWGEPTNFKEKILVNTIRPDLRYDMGMLMPQYAFLPKIHTIRAGSRWKAGDLIHMAYGVRSKNYEQFNKGIDGLQRVVSVQEIEIFDPFSDVVHWLFIDGKPWGGDGPENYLLIAQNDGFKNQVELMRWFEKFPFKGQIIHWTDYRYK